MLSRIRVLTPLVFIVVFVSVFWLGTKLVSTKLQKSEVSTTGSVQKFEYLSSQRSNRCGGVAENIEDFTKGENIQGACCGVMDLHRYQEQVDGLKKYSDIKVVPEDPYDIPVTLAKELFGYQKNIQLTEDQQKIYDEAMKMSHEGGPCCCRCWRWTAFEGQAKYLITQHNWASEQIAELWDIEDGCGGPGHVDHS